MRRSTNLQSRAVRAHKRGWAASADATARPLCGGCPHPLLCMDSMRSKSVFGSLRHIFLRAKDDSVVATVVVGPLQVAGEFASVTVISYRL